MHTNQKKRKLKITKGERLLYSGAFVCVALTVLIKIFGGASVGHLNMSVEKAKYDIDVQQKTNESLAMQVNELTSFDKLKDVVKEMGLAYNYHNIVNIEQ